MKISFGVGFRFYFLFLILSFILDTMKLAENIILRLFGIKKVWF